MKNYFFSILLVIFMFASALFAQIGVSFKGGVQIPVGEFSNSYTSGIGGEITFIYRTNPSFEFGILTGYSQYTADEGVLKDRLSQDITLDLEQSNIDAIIDVEAPLSVVPIAFSIKYLFRNKYVKPYFFFEGGIFFYNLTTNANIKVVNGSTIEVEETIQKDNSTMLGIGGGLQYKLSKKLFLDFSAKWNIMNNVKIVESDSKETFKGVDKTVQSIAIIGGLCYYF
jgi:opacity protein-like surface antigen